MTVYNAGAINGAETVARVSGIDVENIEEINKAKVEHVPLKTVIFYHGVISGAATKDTEVAVMPGWYVCNGKDPFDYPLDITPEYMTITIGRFLMGSNTVGTEGGNDTREVLNHTHSLSTHGFHAGHSMSTDGDHTHTINKSAARYSELQGGSQSGSYMKHGSDFEFASSGLHDHNWSNSGNHSNHLITNTGVSSADNRPYFGTLIPLIRLRRTNYNFPIGTVLWYHANDIADAGGRSTDLSEYGLPGWYVMNGNGGSLNYLNLFVRCASPSAIPGGTDTAEIAEHNHSDSISGNHNDHGQFLAGGHTHTWAQDIWYDGGDDNNTTTNWAGGTYPKESVATDYQGIHEHIADYYTNIHDHGGVSTSSGSGDGDNRPAYFNMLLIQRVS